MTGGAPETGLPERGRSSDHRRIYESIAPHYDEWKWQQFWRRNEAPEIAGLLGRAARHASALDIGTGTGAHLGLLGQFAPRVVGLDWSSSMLGRTANEVRLLVRADARRIPFCDSSFDTLLLARVCSDVEDLRPLFAEAARVAAPGALLVVSELDPELDWAETRFGMDTEAQPESLVPHKHSADDVVRAAAGAGFGEASARSFTADALRWRPGPGEFGSLDRNPAAKIFYVVSLTRQRHAGGNL